ncbi:glutamine-hydrolyzing carbamoyl-phosphate synthase small subunit [Methanothermococcus sp. SCGC AD-155-E23]|nr:glutamine-hydrolyzing carbamoyl-phosphate synthase small subunit [Methanothermococcus sp. SCGC AD-155-E23]
MHGILVLEDGTVLKGKGFGAEKEVLGELVFNTSMTGYVEVLTDPSYKGQIVTMTYPLIGNYGVEEKWYESDGIKVEGFVIKDLTREELDRFLKEYDIPGIYYVDTRFITRKIRSGGVVKAFLKTSSEPIDEKEIKKYVELARGHRDLSEMDLVPLVSTGEVIIHRAENEVARCVLIDCGVKRSIIRCLLERGCTVIQVPYNTPPEEILKYKPHFVLVSNGPGDPVRVKEAVETVRSLIGKVPLTGICLGHQIITLALGGETYKMKFGHRGGNQPVEETFPLKYLKYLSRDYKVVSKKLLEMRSVKRGREIELIRRASRISRRAMEYGIECLSRGNITEMELAGEIEYMMRKMGSIKPAFDSIVISDRKTALPHGLPSEDVIKNIVVIDIGAVYRGYCSDITRTVILKEDRRYREVYELISEVKGELEDHLREGVPVKELDRLARDLMGEYKRYFIHSLGHGVGVSVHEEPSISSRTKEDVTLKENMVITLEPGIYLEDFGVRIEDLYLIKKEGFKRL